MLSSMVFHVITMIKKEEARKEKKRIVRTEIKQGYKLPQETE